MDSFPLSVDIILSIPEFLVWVHEKEHSVRRLKKEQGDRRCLGVSFRPVDIIFG